MAYCVPLVCLTIFVMTALGFFLTEVDFFISVTITGIITLAAFFWWDDVATNLSIIRAQQIYKTVSGRENAVTVTVKDFSRMDFDVSGVLWLFTLMPSDTFDCLTEDGRHVGASTAIMVFDNDTDEIIFRLSR